MSRRRPVESPLRFEWERVVKAVLLPAPVKHVALNVATYANADGTGCYPGNERLVADTSLSDATVRRALKRLREVGLLERTVEASRVGRAGVADEYRLAIPDDLLERVVLVSQAGADHRSQVPVVEADPPVTRTGGHRSQVPVPPVRGTAPTGHTYRPPTHDQPIDHESAYVVELPHDRARAVNGHPVHGRMRS